MISFTFGSVIVCDDARKEVTGKDILIGVYGGGINTNQFPTSLNLTFWFEVIPKGAGKLVVDIKVECPGSTNPVTLRLEGDVIKPDEPFSIFTPQLGYAIAYSGDIKLFVKPANKESWKLLKRVPVGHAPTAPS